MTELVVKSVGDPTTPKKRVGTTSSVETVDAKVILQTNAIKNIHAECVEKGVMALIGATMTPKTSDLDQRVGNQKSAMVVMDVGTLKRVAHTETFPLVRH